jgi:hypothetical protein
MSASRPLQSLGEGVFWLYGVTARGQPLPERFPVPLLAVHHHSFSAIVERVRRVELAPDGLEVRMESLPWIALATRRHERVLDALMSEGLMVPAPFGTVFRSLRAVRDIVAASADRFAVVIPRVSGCKEWSIELYCNNRRLLACVTPEVTPEEPARVNPAHAYAVEKQTQARAVVRATRRIDAVVDEVVNELSAHAAEIIELPTPGARDPRRGTLEKKLAALLARSRDEVFRAAVRRLHERLAPEGFSLEASGPGAPFAFCQIDDGSGSSRLSRGRTCPAALDDDPWYRNACERATAVCLTSRPLSGRSLR